MRKSGTEVTVRALPACNFACEGPSHMGGGHLAHYDGRTTLGPWAYMCEAAFREYGVGLGLGKGQRLVTKNGT